MEDALVLRRLSKFVVVGAWNTVVGYLIFVGVALVAGDRLHHQIILAISFAISVVHAYVMQRYLVFNSRAPVRRELPKFVTVNLSALAVNAVLLEILVRMSVELLLAQLVATFATTLLSFVAHQAWSFRHTRP
jgi:putative flippase GtrA